MKKFKIKFRNESGETLKGLVMDKVLVLVVGANANFHNYVVQEAYNLKIHIINPLNIIEIIQDYDDSHKIADAISESRAELLNQNSNPLK